MSVKRIIGIILVLVAVVWLLHELWVNWRINQIRKWPTTTATIINTSAEPVSLDNRNVITQIGDIADSVTDNAKYEAHVMYKYNVYNREYESDSIAYDSSNRMNGKELKLLFGGLKPGQQTTILYNPSDPDESYMFVGKHSYWPILWAIILLIIGAALLAHKSSDNSDVKIKEYNYDRNPDVVVVSKPRMHGINYNPFY
jgi:hypothetical protein